MTSFASALECVIANLRKSKKVNSFDVADITESEVLAHALLDMEESFKRILEEMLPKLKSQDMDADNVDEILLDIGEELRHILYHVKEPKYYDYLISF